MGWKGTMRSVAATARRMEKDAQRRHKQTAKEQVAADASDAVSNWETYLDELLSIHINLAERIDWERMLARSKPSKPKTVSHNEDRAARALEDFKPRMFDFLRGGSANRKESIQRDLNDALQDDRIENDRLAKKHGEEVADWENDRSLAKRLSEGEDAAIHEVLVEFQTFSENDLIGSSVQFAINDGYVHARPQVHSEDVVPSFRRKQLASGKLSETKMPAGQFNELYQDYVASVALKVAGDMFQILPLNEVFVTCEAEMLNSASGHKEPTPILSVQVVRPTFEKLNLKSIDPSDSMSNFNHTMKFSKTKGFSRVQPLSGSSNI